MDIIDDVRHVSLNSMDIIDDVSDVSLNSMDIIDNVCHVSLNSMNIIDDVSDVSLNSMDIIDDVPCTIGDMTQGRSIDRSAAVFGQAIARLRSQRGWTIVDLAKVAGFHRTYVGQIELGHNNPTLSTILRLAKALGVSASELIREVEGGGGS